jgi:quercetin dioxygenase-like cupin family protein
LTLRTLASLAFVSFSFAAEHTSPKSIKIETLANTTSAWDGAPYKSYPAGQPQLSVLKITIAPHTTMKWHSHSMPNAGYILSGELTIEKEDGTKKHFVAGQAVAETTGETHRGITGEKPVVLIVFYAGTPGLPLSR